MLELKHISYQVSDAGAEQTILNDVSVTIPDGELVVFTGPNGGGKTTLAKIIMDAMYPYLVSNVACAINLRFAPLVYLIIFLGCMLIYAVIHALLSARIK